MTIDTSTLPKPQYTISASSDSNMISTISDPSYTYSFDTNITSGSSTLSYDTSTINTPTLNITTDPLGTEWQRKTFINWPSEVVIEDMIKKYPGLKVQYEKFMTVYNLVKDDYTYEGDQ